MQSENSRASSWNVNRAVFSAIMSKEECCVNEQFRRDAKVKPQPNLRWGHGVHVPRRLEGGIR